MTASNTAVSAKDGTGATLNMTFAAESVSTRNAQKTYLGSPSSEALVEPMQQTGGTITPLTSGDIIVTPSANFTRPSNTTPYVAGQLVGNSTTAGSVVPLSWVVARINGGNLYVRRATMLSTGKSITNAAFVLYLYTVSPTIASGDGASFSTTVANCSGAIPINLTLVGTDAAIGWGAPSVGGEINIVAAGGSTTIYGLLQAAVAYTPISGEVITVNLEVHQN